MKKVQKHFLLKNINYRGDYLWVGFIFAFVWLSCQKEEKLQPSNKDETHLTVEDSNDPVDHAIYQFYQNTEIPVFYNDTIARKQVGDNTSTPTYFYIRLALAYAPSGFDSQLQYTLAKNRQQVIPMLNFLKNDILPRIPKTIFIPSVLLVDSLRTYLQLNSFTDSLNITAYRGFNTVAIKEALPDTMQTSERNEYAAAILAVLAAEKLNREQRENLNSEFFSISKMLASNSIVYNQEFNNLSPDGSMAPEDFGFIYYHIANDLINTTVQSEDLRAYLEAVFTYSTAMFHEAYSNYPVVLEKFDVLKTKVRSLGFQFTD